MHQQIAANQRRAALLLALAVLVPLIIVGLLGLLLGHPWLGAAVGLAIGVGVAVFAYLRCERFVLAWSQAVPANRQEQQRLHNLVEGLCAAGGLASPSLFVVHEPAPNAFVSGRSARHASLAVTTGLLDTLTRVELEGVVAQQLSHIRNLDVLPGTLAAVLAGWALPVSAPLMRLAVGAAPQAEADGAGVQLTRYPPGLVAALEKVRTDARPTVAVRRATAHLWLVDGAEPLDDRIAALRER